MKRRLVPILAFALVGCGDFVDADGNTSIRQVAEGLQSLGDQLSDMGEALQRDADVEAVPSDDLRAVIPERVGGASMLDLEGDDARDRNGAGMSMAAGKYLVDGSRILGIEAFVPLPSLEDPRVQVLHDMPASSCNSGSIACGGEVRACCIF